MQLHTAADLMTPAPLTVTADASLHDAHALMREHNIRHIPVTDGHGTLIGMLTQKLMIAQVMRIISVFGAPALERKEKQTQVGDIMLQDFDTVAPGDALSDIAEFFLNNRHGCMPVVEEQKLLGILTSSDFVRLSVELLKKS
ncbi:CBS domain-containing protein [Pseudoalteromonas sp. MM17-2]|uniref:CBS domain-containing protein n=1 Tax=Pseudoalteromonas sp. MM17-2 TaxID=2917753 RepID=UPI001EF4D082|nr:CBS domain-containing protein [Pseudoalteromonas sp. MM17-2]MCG7544371.1 CBS domain-containing protein [Pseudoalteromonas sp. MM17-2]